MRKYCQKIIYNNKLLIIFTQNQKFAIGYKKRKILIQSNLCKAKQIRVNFALKNYKIKLIKYKIKSIFCIKKIKKQKKWKKMKA